ncbi:hypothetical protein E2C01_020843 [Portunus trituberculatus]|uniref:Uncharacterized protein n=1 Tax=Portunus trituberculatus TaxID=210409 RepID=A0A5B7E2M6_PORTR|nr:hypothetical protein [Portunus trituberculatus]
MELSLPQSGTAATSLSINSVDCGKWQLLTWWNTSPRSGCLAPPRPPPTTDHSHFQFVNFV